MKRIIPILLIINNLLFIISLAISLVILFRPFYYWHIDYLSLPEETGYTYDEIKESYDDVLDYLVFNKTFSTGKLKYSDNGKKHFEDCRILFIINFVILAISSLIIILKKKFFDHIRFLGHNISYCSSIFMLSSFLFLLFCSLVFGFNKVFKLFHKILFFGKTNWKFKPSKDEIINILPEKYFMDCAILILVIVSLISIIIIIKEKRRKNLKKR